MIEAEHQVARRHAGTLAALIETRLRNALRDPDGSRAIIFECLELLAELQGRPMADCARRLARRAREEGGR